MLGIVCTYRDSACIRDEILEDHQRPLRTWCLFSNMSQIGFVFQVLEIVSNSESYFELARHILPQ